MRFRIVIAALLTCLPCLAAAQDPAVPEFPQAVQAPARLGDEGRLVYWETLPCGDGVAHTIPLEKVRFLTVDGRDVSAEDAKKQLATWNPMLIGTMLPPDYVYPTPAPLAPDFAQALGREQAEAYRSLQRHPMAWAPGKPDDLEQNAATWKNATFHSIYFKPDTVLRRERNRLLPH